MRCLWIRKINPENSEFQQWLMSAVIYALNIHIKVWTALLFIHILDYIDTVTQVILKMII